MDLQQLVLLAIRTSVILTVFGFGLGATPADVLHLVRRPGLLLRSLLAMFVIMPIVAVALTRMFQFRPAVAVALVALALSPVPPILPRKESNVGRLAYALGLLATAALLSIVAVPVSLWIIGRYIDRSLAIAPAAVARIAVITVLFPLAAGVLFRMLFPVAAQRLMKPVMLTATILLSLGALAILAASFPALMNLVGNGTLVAMAVFVVVGLTAGHLLGGPENQDRSVLALSTACRHPGIAMAIGAAAYPGEPLGPAILLYLLVSAILCVPYIARLGRPTTGGRVFSGMATRARSSPPFRRDVKG